MTIKVPTRCVKGTPAWHTEVMQKSTSKKTWKKENTPLPMSLKSSGLLSCQTSILGSMIHHWQLRKWKSTFAISLLPLPSSSGLQWYNSTCLLFQLLLLHLRCEKWYSACFLMVLKFPLTILNDVIYSLSLFLSFGVLTCLILTVKCFIMQNRSLEASLRRLYAESNKKWWLPQKKERDASVVLYGFSWLIKRPMRSWCDTIE